MPKKPTQSDSKEQSISFKNSLSELESIVTRLESGELPLEDALNEFERRVQLARQGQQNCNRQSSAYRSCSTTIMTMLHWPLLPRTLSNNDV